MRCPVCGRFLPGAASVLDALAERFAPCQACRPSLLDPRRPPDHHPEPCVCGRRSLDGVMAAVHRVLVDEGALCPDAPLASVGSPLLSPLAPLRRPPHLPRRSLILQTLHATPASARRLLDEVPELKGVVADRRIVPGVDGRTHDLLAGCDVYSTVRITPAGPLVLYRQASSCHIEAPGPRDPKVAATDRALGRTRPDVFVDACAGVGTLGLVAGLRRVPTVVLNDRWGPAAWFAGLNLEVNRAPLGIETVEHLRSFAELRARPIREEPEVVAAGHGRQEVLVTHGTLWAIPALLPPGLRLAALDPFDKEPARLARILQKWQNCAGGEVFIP
ncbi:MAG TPA: hypothetical protein PLY91_02610 [Methanoregulaceae archaeon]|nr:hypothetical protein [Methanoregulaceae archaeon]